MSASTAARVTTTHSKESQVSTSIKLLNASTTAHTHTHTRTCTRTRTRTRMHTCTHTRTHAHMHAQLAKKDNQCVGPSLPNIFSVRSISSLYMYVLPTVFGIQGDEMVKLYSFYCRNTTQSSHTALVGYQKLQGMPAMLHHKSYSSCTIGRSWTAVGDDSSWNTITVMVYRTALFDAATESVPSAQAKKFNLL